MIDSDRWSNLILIILSLPIKVTFHSHVNLPGVTFSLHPFPSPAIPAPGSIGCTRHAAPWTATPGPSRCSAAVLAVAWRSKGGISTGLPGTWHDHDPSGKLWLSNGHLWRIYGKQSVQKYFWSWLVMNKCIMRVNFGWMRFLWIKMNASCICFPHILTTLELQHLAAGALCRNRLQCTTADHWYQHLSILRANHSWQS